MCYAAPGPRCYSDAKKDYDKSMQKIAEFKAEHGEEDLIMAKGFGILKEYRALKLDARNKKDDVQQTKQYIDDLSEALAAGTVKEEEEEAAYAVLHEAKMGYDQRMLEYDQKNNTVLGRQPSKYGSLEGVQHLAMRVRDADTPEKAEAALRAYEHAAMTLDRFTNGDISLPVGHRMWQEVDDNSAAYENLSLSETNERLRNARAEKKLLLTSLQHMYIDNAKNPYSSRYRMNVALKEAEIAEADNRVKSLEKAAAKKDTQHFTMPIDRAMEHSQNAFRLSALQTMIAFEERAVAHNTRDPQHLEQLRREQEQLFQAQKDIEENSK